MKNTYYLFIFVILFLSSLPLILIQEFYGIIMTMYLQEREKTTTTTTTKDLTFQEKSIHIIHSPVA